ncbi:Anaerobic sulfatase-maturating enzyme [Pandoraea capi]|uniref:Anaerobic sulfatase-maturating enzyme n=1 Tax=Pandoraea capi TaxID=2508286 RepID=A0ABY6W972_9BURK|nr:dynobactin maturation radical SAM/SPASM protein DynA [Pandoraea capi]VVE41922.1 Anaerobic sulfatase-maturating enzyme [Pandoraea capi]
MRLVNVVKPTHICNLACTYCYNDDVRKPVMDVETLGATIRETLELAKRYESVDEVDFIWHGGEPLVAGRRFFERIIEFQKTFANGVRFTNSVQTNGTLIDLEWARFFAGQGFDVSLSLDGPEEINDRFRVYRSGAGSFERTWKALETLRSVGLNPGVCIVLNRATITHTKEILQFLSKHRLGFNVIPLTLSGAARDHYDELSISPQEYARAWISMYDDWISAGDDYVYGHDFVVKTRAILYGKPADCIGMSNCADFNLSVDPVGDVYPCASMSGNAAAVLGNIAKMPLAEVVNSDRAIAFRTRAIDPQCAQCKWQHVCHGGCMSRAYKFTGDINSRDYYCPGLYEIYEHVAERLERLSIVAGKRNAWHMTDGLDPILVPPKRGTAKKAPRVIPIHSISEV